MRINIFYGQRTTTKKDMTKLAIFNGLKLGFRKRGGFAMIIMLSRIKIAVIFR